ncbi:959_t:CDS:1, partial [Paraglomus occultum]
QQTSNTCNHPPPAQSPTLTMRFISSPTFSLPPSSPSDPISLPTLPTEIFITLCSYISPRDLISLSLTCRLFNSYLCSSTSSTTQHIWRSTRKQYFPNAQTEPYDGLDERVYTILLLDRACEYCKQLHTSKIPPRFRATKTVRGKKRQGLELEKITDADDDEVENGSAVDDREFWARNAWWDGLEIDTADEWMDSEDEEEYYDMFHDDDDNYWIRGVDDREFEGETTT